MRLLRRWRRPVCSSTRALSETFGVAAAEAILTGLPVAARQSGGVPWIIELSGGFGRVAADDDPDSFAGAIDAVLDGELPVDAATARRRLVDSVGAEAVARQAIAIYERETQLAGSGPVSTTTASEHVSATTRAVLPKVLLATGREQALRLVAALPRDLWDKVVLVTPAQVGEPDESGPAPVPEIRIVEAAPVSPRKPRTRGRSPLARLRRALEPPAPPTADELLNAAIGAAGWNDGRRRWPASKSWRSMRPRPPTSLGLGEDRARLAPGSLRWLADRWAAERDGVPPSP